MVGHCHCRLWQGCHVQQTSDQAWEWWKQLKLNAQCRLLETVNIGINHNEKIFEPQKSMYIGESEDICNGSGRFSGPFAWHAMHVSISLLAILSILGNQTFSLNSRLVLTSPWWPSCANDIAFSRNKEGITIRWSRSMMLDESLTVSSSLTCLNKFSSVWSMFWNSGESVSSLSHSWVHTRWVTHCKVLSWTVAFWISSNVMALGTACEERKLTYSSARELCLVSLMLECRDR